MFSTLNPIDKAKRQNPNDKAIRALTLNPINKAKGQNPNAEALRSRSAVTLNPEPYILKGPSQNTETSLNDFLRPCYVSASDAERAENLRQAFRSRAQRTLLLAQQLF